MEIMIDNSSYIDDSWGVFQTFHNAKDTINRLQEECNETYPTLLFPTQLLETLRNYFDDKDSMKIYNVMELIANFGNDESLKKDWDLYKHKPFKPHLVYPKKKEAVKKIVDPYYPTETKEAYRPSGCFLSAIVILIVFAILSFYDGWMLWLLITTIIPLFVYFLLSDRDPNDSKHIPGFYRETKYIRKRKSLQDLKEEEKRAEDAYKKEVEECDLWNAHELPKLIRKREQKHNQDLEDYHKSLENWKNFWQSIPKLIESEFPQALTRFIREQINFEIEFTEEENPRRGATEELFLTALIKCGVEKVKRDISVNDYYPDFSIIDEYYFVDIEIDEPYIYETGEPIHYIGCGDEERNVQFQNLGAFVIRFTEDQIRHSTKVCSKVVLVLQKFTETGDVAYLREVLELSESIRQKRWTYKKAHIMADYRYRNK